MVSPLLAAVAASLVNSLQSLRQPGNNKQHMLEIGLLVGWYDPRILGGRFLDVRHEAVFYKV